MVMLESPVFLSEVKVGIKDKNSKVLSCELGAGLYSGISQGMLASKHNGKLSVVQQSFYFFIKISQSFINRR
ncbi:hypothetical protein SDC9_183874 [bioreactor metagenome]|uniref:Uncharacterized protein n=1 Tax=bioreactor metagenome TaxID=1076179 RepID=A0A645HBG1_9ZZZZ